MNKKNIIQISLDVTTIEEALALAHGAVKAGVDWLEAGTPLILAEGLHGVRALRREFPNVPIVADLKTMDGAGLEAEMMFQAGADMVVVTGTRNGQPFRLEVDLPTLFAAGGRARRTTSNCPPRSARRWPASGLLTARTISTSYPATGC